MLPDMLTTSMDLGEGIHTLNGYGSAGRPSGSELSTPSDSPASPSVSKSTDLPTTPSATVPMDLKVEQEKRTLRSGIESSLHDPPPVVGPSHSATLAPCPEPPRLHPAPWSDVNLLTPEQMLKLEVFQKLSQPPFPPQHPPHLVQKWSFHDHKCAHHYHQGCLPWILANQFPILIPIHPNIVRLERNWELGEVPAFKSFSETLRDLSRWAEAIRKGELFKLPLNQYQAKLTRYLGTQISAESLDSVVEKINGTLKEAYTMTYANVLDTITGILTGWAHHFFMPVPMAKAMKRLEEQIKEANQVELHPRKIHLRNPLHNGLMFLEFELLREPLSSLTS